jgi:Endonuclease/Exonuclease/phosphatase family
MVTFLFWNVGSEARATIVARLATQYDVDILLLAEVVDQPADLLLALNTAEAAYSYAPGVENTKICVIARFSASFIAPVFETDRLTVRKLCPPGMVDILLGVIHFPSKYAWNEESQAMESARLADEMRRVEKRVGHCRTVLVGDFNMNPFESGMVSAGGMHGIMDRRIVQRRSRIVQDRKYPFFYNPMWCRFGDGTAGPAGTFYHTRAEHKVYFWNMFDQVLVRPELLDRFAMDDLAIVDHTGERSLLTAAGLPDKHYGSDHLPVLFKLVL